jgi:hypothetical protein
MGGAGAGSPALVSILKSIQVARKSANPADPYADLSHALQQREYGIFEDAVDDVRWSAGELRFGFRRP